MMKSRTAGLFFTRSDSAANAIEELINHARASVDVALYRLSNPQLARALHNAFERGVQVRVVLDRQKYKLTQFSQELLREVEMPYRLLSGRGGRYSKMHHKFAVFDDSVVATGSYNWTLESEERNYENLVVLREPEQARKFAHEFEALWAVAEKRRPFAAAAAALVKRVSKR